jgi:hypothetical protein
MTPCRIALLLLLMLLSGGWQLIQSAASCPHRQQWPTRRLAALRRRIRCGW